MTRRGVLYKNVCSEVEISETLHFAVEMITYTQAIKTNYWMTDGVQIMSQGCQIFSLVDSVAGFPKKQLVSSPDFACTKTKRNQVSSCLV